MLRLGKTVA
jgi:hypothetical protein